MRVGRWPPGHETQHRQLLVRVERETERLGATVTDVVARALHELGVAGDRPIRIGDSRKTADRRGDRLRDRLAIGGAVGTGVGAAAERRVAADLKVDLAVDVADQGVERVMQRVGEDQRSRNERDADDDRQGRQRHTQLAREKASERDVPHLSYRASSSARAPSPP